MRWLEIALVVILVLGGGGLRWHHLGTPSLWWDEIVQIRTAERPSVAAVWTATREGSSGGAGNAGAMPLDYLLLHAWTRVASPPTPATLERHYRLPAFIASAAALPAIWALARLAGGPVAGMTALALLATSLPHVAYAAEARPYALLVLTTIGMLATLVALARKPDSPARWAAFCVTSIACMGSALYGALPLGLALVALGPGAVAAWRRGGARTPAVAIGVVGLVVALALLWWLDPRRLGVVYPRAPHRFGGPLTTLWTTTDHFAGGDPVRRSVFLAGLASTLAWWRFPDRGVRALAIVLTLAPATLPIITAIAEWKHYYYHPRHAAFLLPMLPLAAGLGAGWLTSRMRRPTVGGVVITVLLLTWSVPGITAFLRDPRPVFRTTKTLRDHRGLTALLAERVRALAPGTSYLVALERRQAGHLANPTLAFYLAAWGVGDRIVLRGIGHPARTLERLAAACPNACRGPVGPALVQTLDLGDPFDLVPPARLFWNLPWESWIGGSLGGIAVVTWVPLGSAATPPGLRRTPLYGLDFFEPKS